jgi:hypothetical protein
MKWALAGSSQALLQQAVQLHQQALRVKQVLNRRVHVVVPQPQRKRRKLPAVA